MKYYAKQLLSDLLSVFDDQIQTIKLHGQDKQRLRRAFKRDLKPVLSKFEANLPASKRQYKLSYRGRQRLIQGANKARAKLVGESNWA